MATAAAVEFTDNSLPPLSHLLTTNDPVPHSQCRKWQMPSLEHHNRLKDEVFMMHPLYSSTTQPELFPHTHSVRSHHLPSPPISVVDNGMINNDGHQKTFSFIPIPGVQHKKRPRRKHHEVERLYKCNFQNCTKAYGTLNHLNAHVSMQKHGPKRQPSEFKELRKMWRKQKRENKMHQKSRDEHRLSTWSVDSQQSYAHYMPQWRPCYSPYEFMPSDY